MSLRREGVRWLVKAGAGFAVGMVLLTLWVEVVGIRPELAALANHALISVAAYLVTDTWVFQSHQSPVGLRGHARQYLSYQAVMLSSKAGNYLIFVALVWLGMHYLIAWTVGAIAMVSLSFVGNKAAWSHVPERS